MRVRLPRDMQDQLHQMAGDQGVTVNAVILTLLTEAMGFSLVPKPTDDAQESVTAQDRRPA